MSPERRERKPISTDDKRAGKRSQVPEGDPASFNEGLAVNREGNENIFK